MKACPKYFESSKSFRRSKRTRAAFTLIELLVIIAIITILAALLLPTLSRAKSAADAVVCKNNLRQISIGLHLYLNDFGAYVLFAETIREQNRANYEWWFEKLKPYV